MRRLLSITLFSLLFCISASGQDDGSAVVPGDCRMDHYLPALKGRSVGVVCNHTAVVDNRHLIDTLLSHDVKVARIFAPEHGFRGDADAGQKLMNFTDAATGIEVVSIYGSNKKPKPEDVEGLHTIVFDIQDVGVRFYTYLSTLHYVMESCAENGLKLVLLDRPNPNGMYVDGPVLDLRYRSFVGMHPIPVVHGMTLGELARMINGQRWLAGARKCDLTVVPCLNYTHATRYVPPIAPSPNLPDIRSIYLYPSLCYFEATSISVGRGTAFPFKVYGHPSMKAGHSFSFTPRSVPGATDPPLKDKPCYGADLRNAPSDDEVIGAGINLAYLIDGYKSLDMGDKFFTSFFEKLIGVDYVRKMIEEGRTAEEIKGSWRSDVEAFKRNRKPYLLYE